MSGGTLPSQSELLNSGILMSGVVASFKSIRHVQRRGVALVCTGDVFVLYSNVDTGSV